METVDAARRPAVVDASTAAVAREGVIGGVIGAASVATWFLVADGLAGRPFQTPATLGARFFLGTSLSGMLGMPHSTAALAVGYTIIYGLAFVAAGLLIAAVVSTFERTPPLLIPGFFFLVIFFELVYYTYVLAFVEPVIHAVDWWAILIGNLIAVASMSSYFWRKHPHLLRRLVRG